MLILKQLNIKKLPLKKVNVIKDKSFKFALRIVKLYKYLKGTKNEYVLSKQLLRSGTAIGALYREAEYAESSADFIHKLSIAQKECNETIYWLELLQASDFIAKNEFESINVDATEILKLLTSIIKSKKTSINH